MLKVKKEFRDDEDGGKLSKIITIDKDLLEYKKSLGPKMSLSCYKYYWYDEVLDEWILIT